MFQNGGNLLGMGEEGLGTGRMYRKQKLGRGDVQATLEGELSVRSWKMRGPRGPEAQHGSKCFPELIWQGHPLSEKIISLESVRK